MPTPITEPRIQWLGSGLGHIGSTSNRGASTMGRVAPWSAAWPAASARIEDTSKAARRRFRRRIRAPVGMDASRDRGYTRGTRTPNRVILPRHRWMRPASVVLAVLGLL